MSKKIWTNKPVPRFLAKLFEQQCSVIVIHCTKQPDFGWSCDFLSFRVQYPSLKFHKFWGFFCLGACDRDIFVALCHFSIITFRHDRKQQRRDNSDVFRVLLILSLEKIK